MNKLKIKKLGVLSVANMYAVMAAGITLLIAIPYGLIIIIFSLIGASTARGDNAFAFGGIGVIGGIAIMFILPIVYAIISWIAGALSALIYNFFATIVGGIEIEVETIY
jgi:hypothetical protein